MLWSRDDCRLSTHSFVLGLVSGFRFGCTYAVCRMRRVPAGLLCATTVPAALACVLSGLLVSTDAFETLGLWRLNICGAVGGG